MDGIRLILAGNLVDGNGGEVRRNVFLAVADGVITGIGPAADVPRSSRAAIVDLSHCTVVPALVDCSVSLTRSPSMAGGVRLSPERVAPAPQPVLLTRHLRYCHAHGVLGVADNNDLSQLPGRAQQGTLNDVRSAGPDFLRIVYSAEIGDQGGRPPRLSFEELCRLSRQRGKKKLVVVANSPQQVAEALAAGCDAIEQGYGMGEAQLREMAKKGVLWIPSILRAKTGLDGARAGGAVCCRFSTRFVAPGKPLPGAEAFWQKTLARQREQLRLARELGVKVAVGTGAGSAGILHGEAVVEEMKLFVKAGFSLAETVRCASENGARFFGMESLGALAVGRRATFLVSRGTGQQLPRKLAYLEAIYRDGRPSASYRKNPA